MKYHWRECVSSVSTNAYSARQKKTGERTVLVFDLVLALVLERCYSRAFSELVVFVSYFSGFNNLLLYTSCSWSLCSFRVGGAGYWKNRYQMDGN